VKPSPSYVMPYKHQHVMMTSHERAIIKTS
jgi:hypothetical protein